MSWIKTIDQVEAQGSLKEICHELVEQRGKVANIMKVQSLNPKAMKAHLDLYMTLMLGKSGLARWERELVAVTVSTASECDYCVNHHAEALDQYWRDDHKIGQLIEEPESLELPERPRRMFQYTQKLTRSPRGVNSTGVEAFRQVGLSDEDILNVNLIASDFNFVNRIVLGLGVRFTPEEVPGYKI
jgi:uncharacterized peroxidase-related enzyme